MRELQSPTVIEGELGPDRHVPVPVLTNQTGSRRDIRNHHAHRYIEDQVAVVNKAIRVLDRCEIVRKQKIGTEGQSVLRSKMRNKIRAEPDSVDRTGVE